MVTAILHQLTTQALNNVSVNAFVSSQKGLRVSAPCPSSEYQLGETVAEGEGLLTGFRRSISSM